MGKEYWERGGMGMGKGDGEEGRKMGKGGMGKEHGMGMGKGDGEGAWGTRMEKEDEEGGQGTPFLVHGFFPSFLPDWNTWSDEDALPQLRRVSCASLACLLKHTGLFLYATNCW